jgi:transcription termination factor Rho
MNLQRQKKVSKIIKFNKSAYEKKIALKKRKKQRNWVKKLKNCKNDASETQEVVVLSKKVNPNQLNKQNQNPILN